MELIKNVFFNTDKLVENSIVKLSYVGKFFEENSNRVFLHYGFGANWDNVNEIEMSKTELGFQAEFQLDSAESLNFCFKNENSEWDNNEGKDYSFPIEPSQVSLIELDDNNSLSNSRGLRKSYIWSKKIKLAVYKLFRFIPKIISSGNYKRKVDDEN